MRTRGNRSFQSGQYIEAADSYQKGYSLAISRGEPASAVRFLNNLGSARYELLQYREAAKAYLEARNVARAVGDRETLGALCFNLSSLYFGMGDTEAAAQSAQQGRSALDGIQTDFRSRLLIQSALIDIRQKNRSKAVAELHAAVGAARAEKDMAGEAQAWNELGNALRDGGDLHGAETALLEGYRLRKLSHDDRLCYSYQALGRLRVDQGQIDEASVLFGRAIESARHLSPAALWDAYFDRGKADRAAGRLDDAFADFASALKWMRRWRAEVLPADAFRVTSEVALHDAYSAFIEVGMLLFRQTGNDRFAKEAFAAAEESRTFSLRALRSQADAMSQRLPGEYWETLARLHSLETRLVARDEAGVDASTRALRLRLAELETRAGLQLPPDEDTVEFRGDQALKHTRRALQADDAYIGFTLAASHSWMWIATDTGFECQDLPGEAEIGNLAHLFTRAVSEGSPDAVRLGASLYTRLFATARRRLDPKRVWIMALDGPLFEVPFAALITGNDPDGKPAYLMEDHVLEMTPGGWSFVGAASEDAAGPFVGVGDPVYNRADPRFRTLAGNRTKVAARSQTGFTGPELSRLAGSDREIEQCARIWRCRRSQVLLLKGRAASKDGLVAAIGLRPSVLHIAAHVVFPARDPGYGMVALSMRPESGVEFLSAAEIAGMRTKLGLVVLNGCSSAQGAILPGAGLMGMTRAWLAAGARAVIASRWPTPDDNTELFTSFYEELEGVQQSATRYPFARALQQAQIRQLRTGGRHAGPAYWGDYFCVAMR